MFKRSREQPRHVAVRRPPPPSKPRDPEIELHKGADEIVRILVTDLRGTHGIRVENVLGALGSLAGFAVPAAAHATAVARGMTPEQLGIMVIAGPGGSRQYGGDRINRLLLGTPRSVWSLIGGKAKELGSHEPDAAAILRRTSAIAGSPEAPPSGKGPDDSPIIYVTALWPAFAGQRDRYCADPDDWPVLFSYAAQQVMQMGKDSIAPADAATIVLECAVPMSRIDPEPIQV